VPRAAPKGHDLGRSATPPRRQIRSLGLSPNLRSGYVSRASPPYACYFLIVSFRAFLIGDHSPQSLSSSSSCSSLQKALLGATAVSKGKVRPGGVSLPYASVMVGKFRRHSANPELFQGQ